ncbi:MAG: mechanosensitive ion channel domain-containing protein [Thiolinea sp.]
MFDQLASTWNELYTEFMNLMSYEWFIWGLGCIIAYPTLLILINEFNRRLTGDNEVFTKPLITFRNIMLPLVLFYVLLAKVSVTGSESIFLKIVITLFWLLFLHQTLQVVNIILFSDAFKLQEKMPRLLMDIARVFMVLLGAMFIVAYIWGIDVTSFLAAFGMGSVILGFALRDVLGGLFSGLSLLSAAPFKVGDWISITNTVGQVQSIDWRSVTLKTKDNYIVVIPNAKIAGEKLLNFSRPTPKFRVRMDVKMDMEYPPNRVMKLLTEIAKKTPGVLHDPPPHAVVMNYIGGEAVDYQIRYYIENFQFKRKTHTLLMANIWYLCQREKMNFPPDYQPLLHLMPDDIDNDVMPQNVIVDHLKGTRLFDINDDDYVSLAEKTTVSTFGAKEIILDDTAPSEYFYLILQGEVRQCFVKEGIHTFCNDSLKSGEFFGFSGMVSSQIGNEQIEAMEDTLVALIELDRVRKVLQRNPKVADGFESILLAKNAMAQNTANHRPGTANMHELGEEEII